MYKIIFLQELAKFQKAVLYFDTDSIILKLPKDILPPESSSVLGG